MSICIFVLTSRECQNEDDNKHDKHNSHMRVINIQINNTSDIGLTANLPEEGRIAQCSVMNNKNVTKRTRNKSVENSSYHVQMIQAATIVADT